MLFQPSSLDEAERAVLDRIDEMRHELRFHVVQNPRRWTGLLARMTRARAVRGSNSIEGINISHEDAMAAVDGEDPSEADRPTWRAVVGYQQAMTYLLQRCSNPDFRFTMDVVLAVHFMITQDNLNSHPGSLRPGWVGVRNSMTGELVHEGVDRDALEPLLDELIHYMNAGANEPTLIKAAMVHLNLAMLHPFSDGNGRVARCLQTAVLTNEGTVSPTFSSIEEYTGRNWQAYYDALAAVGGGKWNPSHDTKPWIRFCIAAHYIQAQTVLRRTREIERVYDELSNVVSRHKLPERTTLALLEAAFGMKVKNASYRVGAGISNNLASRDLRSLVDEGLLLPEGEKRGRSYGPSEDIKLIRQRHRLPKGDASELFDRQWPRHSNQLSLL